METPISKEDFVSTKDGSIILDEFNNPWTFIGDDSLIGGNYVERILENPNKETVSIIHTLIWGRDNILNEQLAIIPELNHPRVKLKK